MTLTEAQAPPLPAEAIILVGGLGTRLRATVPDLPKPLAPIAGRPFLHWLLEGLAHQGLRRIVLAIGYRGAMVREAVGRRYAGMAIDYAEEHEPLGTGGAIWAALDHCSGSHVFVLNGDTWLGAALAEIAGLAPSADLVIAVRQVPDRARFGSVLVDGDRVLGLEEKGRQGAGLVNGGIYLLRRDLPQRRPMAGAFSLEHEILAQPATLDIRVFRTDAPFIDIGTPEDYVRAQELLPRWAAA